MPTAKFLIRVSNSGLRRCTRNQANAASASTSFHTPTLGNNSKVVPEFIGLKFKYGGKDPVHPGLVQP